MKNQNYSPIGEKLRRISSYRVQKKELYYWKNGWRMKHFPLIEKIRSLAVQSNNQELIRLTEQLELLDNRCFGELDELIGIVSDPKRRLDDVGAMQDLYYEFHVQQQYGSHNDSKSHPPYSTQYGAEYGAKRSRIESKPVESNRTTSDRIRKEPEKTWEVLKASHHGSKNSTGGEFLDAANPEYTIISAGRDNRYGHPHAETLERLAACGSRVLSTQEYGAIQIMAEADGKLTIDNPR